MNNFWMSVIEGIGFGIGFGLISAGEKLWARVISVVRVLWTARQLTATGRGQQNPLRKGLWTPRAGVTPKAVRHISARSRYCQVENSEIDASSEDNE